MKHSGRKHSKFSARGAERWFNCSGSVALSEGQPDKTSKWAEEGTKAHGILEQILGVALMAGATKVFYPQFPSEVPKEMIFHGTNAANFILGIAAASGGDVNVETRVYLDFIHPDAFGTLDSSVSEDFGTLNIFDYKYGAGHSVSPKENLQMIFYALGAAHLHHWNFKRVRLWIIQPRIKGYDGPVFWDISIKELRDYIPLFEEAIHRVEQEPVYTEGPWCHWCKAKSVCPLKKEARTGVAQRLFANAPELKGSVVNAKSEADWRKEAKARKKAKTRKAGVTEVEYDSTDFF